MKNCGIVRDLLPLYVDHLISEESETLLKEHLSACTECKVIYERMQIKETIPAPESTAFKHTILSHKRRFARKTILFSVLAILLGIGLCLGILWYKGIFHIIERQTSPDGKTVTTVYNCGFLKHGNLPAGPGITVREEGAFRGQTTYVPATQFYGLWWSPCGNYQVVSMQTEEGIWLALNDFVRNCGVMLQSNLEAALYQNEFFSDVVYDETLGRRRIEFQFVQWNTHQDASMLIHFNYTDAAEQPHEGYFWYNYEAHEISGEMKIK